MIDADLPAAASMHAISSGELSINVVPNPRKVDIQPEWNMDLRNGDTIACSVMGLITRYKSITQTNKIRFWQIFPSDWTAHGWYRLRPHVPKERWNVLLDVTFH